MKCARVGAGLMLLPLLLTLAVAQPAANTTTALAAGCMIATSGASSTGLQASHCCVRSPGSTGWQPIHTATVSAAAAAAAAHSFRPFDRRLLEQMALLPCAVLAAAGATTATAACTALGVHAVAAVCQAAAATAFITAHADVAAKAVGRALALMARGKVCPAAATAAVRPCCCGWQCR